MDRLSTKFPLYIYEELILSTSELTRMLLRRRSNKNAHLLNRKVFVVLLR
jgi:hypothetical protein